MESKQEEISKLTNGGVAQYESSQFDSVFQLFEQTARNYPMYTAIEETNRDKINYETLAKSVNQISTWIYSKTKISSKFVALLLPNGKDYISGVAAVMKLGRTFVPLDPKFPVQRLKIILDDLGNPILLTSRTSVRIIDDLKYDSALVLYIEDVEVMETKLPLIKHSDGDNLYCIYTSGSTGLPKGVIIQNAGFLNWIDWMKAEFQIQAGDRSLAFSNPTFDLSLGQVWPFLCSGGTVVVPALGCNMVELHEFVAKEKITVLFLPTIPAETFFDQTRLTDLRWILFGGELRRSARTKLPSDLPFGICNCYGPTETTISVTFQKFYAEDLLTHSVGRPIPNLSIFILDENQNLVKPGVVGEIYISGIGVSATGYHNREEQNRKVFVETKHGRLCRIGDLGVRTEEGNLEIRGRGDSQVKILGHRVELGDLESNLLSHPAVKQALVLYNTKLDTLHAFVTVKSNYGEELNEDKIKTHMASRLPSFALPSNVLILDEFPLNSNGKIDKKQLLESVNPEANHKQVFKDDTDLETWLTLIWANLLQVPASTLNISSNFFELGGHSILGVKLVSKIRDLLKRPNILKSVAIFYHPTIGELLEALKLELNEEELTKTRLKNTISEATTDIEYFPLSFAQEQIWMSQAQNPESTLWNVVRVIRFNESIAVDLLETSLKRIILTYPCFRTTIHSNCDRTWQVIHQSLPVTLEQAENSDLFDAISRLRNEPFNLQEGPLFRFVLFDQMNLIISYHHIILDGLGWANFLTKLDLFYEKFSVNSNGFSTMGHLEEVAHFRDTVFYERNYSLSASSIDYWASQLENFKPAKLNPSPDSSKFKRQGNLVEKLQFPVNITQRLAQLAQNEKTTLFGLMLATFKILLFRNTHEPDQTLITLFRTGTSQAGTENLMGNFVNLIPIRTVCDGEKTFRQYLGEVRSVLADSLKHGSVPYQKMIQHCKEDRLLKEQLLKTMFQMRPTIDGGLNSFQEIWLDEVGASQVDLGIDICNNDPKGLICAMEFNPSVYSTDSIQRLLMQYEQLCKSILTADENLSIQELNILPLDEQDTILQKFSFTETLQLQSESLVHRFRQQARFRGNLLCVQDSASGALTFGEVDRLSEELADNILKIGNSASFVAILLPRSLQFVISTLAVAKTAKTIVPLNLELPMETVASILEDLDNPVLITDRSYADSLFARSDEDFKMVELADGILLLKNSKLPASQVTTQATEDVMYCIFTSGTTGIPKGVLIKQTSILNVVQVYEKILGLGTEDRSMLFHNPGFDASLMDFWPALITGGSIWIPDASLSFDPKGLFDFTIKNNISYANLPTAIAETLFTNPEWCSDTHVNLRWLTFGGEKLKIAPPKGFPGKCLNAYGPTEATIDTTHLIIDHSTKTLNSIGRPIPNVKVYILDDFKNPVPIGVEGMLWIGGTGVAHGYLKNPELSSQVFVSNPFEPGQQMYCSGDLAKWLEDGSISISGRKDAQVKINGFRVELSEVEVALLTHPSIRQAVVTRCKAIKTALPYLVAFCVPESAESRRINVNDIAEHLKTKLPRYAIPRFLHWLDSIPLTSNGKCDRTALNRFHQENDETGAKKVQRVPLKEEELKLANIWARLLEVDSVELHLETNFFEAGGSSILIGQLIREINAAHLMPISFRDVFEKPTLGAQAVLIQKMHKDANLMDPAAVLSTYQKQIWFRQNFELGEADTSLNRHRVIEVQGENDITFMKPNLTKMLQEYAPHFNLRVFVSEGEIRTKLEKHEITSYIPIPIALTDSQNLESILATELFRPFDLVTGSQPLLRISIYSYARSLKHYICCFWHEILPTREAESSIFLDIEKYLYSSAIQGSQCNLLKNIPQSFQLPLELTNSKNEFDLRPHHDGIDQIANDSTKLIQQSTAITGIWRNIIAKVWSLVTGTSVIKILKNPDTSFFDLQGTYDDLLKTATWLLSLMENRLPLSHFYRHQTVNSLSKNLQCKTIAGAATIIDCILEDEVSEIIAELSAIERIQYQHKHPKGKINVFLTGSTGYLGAFILEAMMDNPNINQIYCLIRGGTRRLEKILEKYGILGENAKVPGNIILLHGDLEKPNFGLTLETYQMLCQNVDVICHCGTQVNLIHSYFQLKGSNVLGTKHVCQLAITGKPKALHYISTTDAAIGHFLYEETEQVAEGRISPPPYWETGYYQTKWVSECLIQHMSQFIPAKIYRVGTIGAPSNRSLVNPTSFDGLFIRAAVAIGAYPDLPGFNLPYSEVDYVANVISNATAADAMVNPTLISNIVQRNYSQSEIYSKLKIPGIDSNEWYLRFISKCESNPNDEKLQSLRLILDQRPWRGVGKLNNFFEVLKHMPVISYPTPFAANAEPDISKYIQLHCL